MGEEYNHAHIAPEERLVDGASGRVWMGKQAAAQTHISAITEVKPHQSHKVRRARRRGPLAPEVAAPEFHRPILHSY